MVEVLNRRKNKCELFIKKGYTANIETGEIFSHNGRLIKGKSMGYILLAMQETSDYSKDKKDIITLLGHQFIWYIATGEVVDCIDHININRADNRISNLRSITKQSNFFNTNAKGFHKRKDCERWEANIHLNRKKIYLGLFKTEEEARDAYVEAKKKYHKIK